jgi:hypothetical protein
MDGIRQKYKRFQQDVNRDNFEQPLLSSIYAWERKAVREIEEIADKARHDLQEWMDKTKSEVQISLNQIIEQVESSKKLDNYTEVDLQKWAQQLEELRNLLEKPTTISIVEDDKPSSFIRIIKVIDKQPWSCSSLSLEKNDTQKPIIGSTEEHFVKMYGPCTLAEENLLVTHSSYRAGLSQITGINQYSSGKHSIHFLIEKKGVKNMFTGVISSSHKVISPTFDYSVHGWWNLNHTIINGECKLDAGNEDIQSGDKMTLILDCDNQQIQLEHHRTTNLVYLPIKLAVCPFPWKILLRLLTPGDCIRILR